MKRRCFLGSIVDGTGVLGAEAGMDFLVFKGEVVVTQESELVDSESEFPGEVHWSKILERGVGHGDERHVFRELM